MQQEEQGEPTEAPLQRAFLGAEHGEPGTLQKVSRRKKLQKVLQKVSRTLQEG